MPAKRPDRPRSCELCHRVQPLTFHHLIPRRNHRRRAFQTRYGKDDLAHRGLWLCRLCHRMLHTTFSEKTLGLELNTREALLARQEVQAFLAWARKQK